jgi:hypothetical protein
MKIKPDISIKSRVKNVKVIIRLDFLYKSTDFAGIEKRISISKQNFNYNRKFELTIPFNINYDGILNDQMSTINFILVRALNDIVGDAKKAASKQLKEIFDVAEIYIVDIYAEKDMSGEDEPIAKWKYKDEY